MLSADEVIQRIKDAPNLLDVSKGSGISYGAVWSIATGQTTDPRKTTIDAAREYFEGVDATKGRRKKSEGRAAA